MAFDQGLIKVITAICLWSAFLYAWPQLKDVHILGHAMPWIVSCMAMAISVAWLMPNVLSLAVTLAAVLASVLAFSVVAIVVFGGKSESADLVLSRLLRYF